MTIVTVCDPLHIYTIDVLETRSHLFAFLCTLILASQFSVQDYIYGESLKTFNSSMFSDSTELER